ncbi:MAG: hypothetical protein PUF50_08860 [Erysipelotrichaceae bacterium]|nr:hypothetical protein [Erysipelotrichaceae bacterium]
MNYLWYFLGFLLLNEIFYWLVRVQPALAILLYVIIVGATIYWVMERRKKLKKAKEEFYKQYDRSTNHQTKDERIKEDQVIDVEYKVTEVE